MQDNSSQPDSSEKIEFEAALLRQEHRLLPLIANFWNRNQFHPNDERRKAICKAFAFKLVYWMLPGGAAVGVSVVSVLSLLNSYNSNALLRQQNQVLIEENRRTERSECIRLLYTDGGTLDANLNEIEPDVVKRLNSGRYGSALPRLRTDAVSSFVAIERQRSNDRVDLSSALLDHLRFVSQDLSHTDFDHACIANTVFASCNLQNCTFRDIRRWDTFFLNCDLRGCVFATNQIGFFRPIEFSQRWMTISEAIELAKSRFDVKITHQLTIKNSDLRGVRMTPDELLCVFDNWKANAKYADGSPNEQDVWLVREAYGGMLFEFDLSQKYEIDYSTGKAMYKVRKITPGQLD